MTRDTQLIHAALTRHLLAGRAITAVTPLSTGHSNETYLLEGLDQILRLPPAGTPLLDGLDMARQFQLYAVLGRLPGAPPVPRVIYYCGDTNVLGAPFYLAERIAGVPFDEYVVPDWLANASEASRGELCRQYVGAYARLAKLRPLEALGPITTAAAECMRWRRFAEIAGHERLVEIMDRLIATPAPASGPPAPVNGDAKLGNILWLDMRLQSVLDWELAFNGEPLSELGYMLYMMDSLVASGLPGMWRRERMIAEWEHVSERAARGIEWFEVAAGAKLTAIIAYGHYLATSGRSTDARLASLSPLVEHWTDRTACLLHSLA